MYFSLEVSIPLRQAKNTVVLERKYDRTTLFQFLLGRLKTRWVFRQLLTQTDVSIPLRQAKNTG